MKRDSDGNEIRYPVILSQTEKEMARKIVMAFRQTVCGFDILRVHGRSYCCDVNGFSFVKNSRKYYDDASKILSEMMLNAVRRDYLQANPNTIVRPTSVPPSLNPGNLGLDRKSAAANRALRESSTASPIGGNGELGSSTTNGEDRPPSPTASMVSDTEFMSQSNLISSTDPNAKRYENEELRCVIAVIRHGDRTPKQKIKVVVSVQKYLDYFHSYAKTPKKDLKVKSKSGLVKFLEITKEIITEDASINQDLRRKLCQLRDVLERWEISGINRKLQMKPQKWDEDFDDEGGSSPKSLAPSPGANIGLNLDDHILDVSHISLEPNISEPPTPSKKKSTSSTPKRKGTGLATELLVILKWGGDLTPMGREQAEHLGAQFRTQYYPDHDNGGVLRLHATYRHDFKIKASDEGRVMKTAAAFTKGLLELEGQLTPILASLVTIEEKNRTMLDSSENFEMKQEMDRCKEHLNKLQEDREITDELIDRIAPECSTVMRAQFKKLENPLKTLRRMYELLETLVGELKDMAEQERQALAEAAGFCCNEISTPSLNNSVSSATPVNSSQLKIEGMNYAPEDEIPKTLDGLPVTREQSSGEGEQDDDEGEEIELPGLYLSETYSLMHDRWAKLFKDFFNGKTGQFDLTKVPDVYDMIRYDILHNYHLNLLGMEELCRLSSIFESCVVPQEYGIDKLDKQYIAAKMCGALVEKIKHDLTVASVITDDPSSHTSTDDRMLYQLDHSHAQDLRINSLERCVRTRLYFTSESHIHTVLNVLRYFGATTSTLDQEALEQLDQILDVSYLSQIVFRLFEDRVERSKFTCEISFSSGTTNDPIKDKCNSLTPSIVLQHHMRLEDLLGLLNNAISLYKGDMAYAGGTLSEKVSSISSILSSNNTTSLCLPNPDVAKIDLEKTADNSIDEKQNDQQVSSIRTESITFAPVQFPTMISSPSKVRKFPDAPKIIRNESITVNMDMKNTSDKWERETQAATPMRYHPLVHSQHKLQRHKSATTAGHKVTKAILVSKDDLDAVAVHSSAPAALSQPIPASASVDSLDAIQNITGNPQLTASRSLTPSLTRTRSRSMSATDVASSRPITPGNAVLVDLIELGETSVASYEESSDQ